VFIYNEVRRAIMNADTVFLERLQNNPPTSKEAWLDYVREAVHFYSDSPLRAEIALELAGNALTHVATTPEDDIQPAAVKGALYELELPAGHIAPGCMEDYTPEEARVYNDFANMYVSYKWRKLAALLPVVSVHN